MKELLRGLLDLALPPVCLACGRPPPKDAALCPACRAGLPWLPHDRCRVCQEAPAGPFESEGELGVCGRCDRNSPLVACTAAVAFRGPVVDWMHRFKYPAQGLAGLDPAPPALARALVREAIAFASNVETPPQVVAPIPLHPRRLRERGFNPAQLLARSAARTLDARLASTLLERTRDTPSQTGLDRRERRRNVRDAFQVRRPRHVPDRVLLVDDVVTTGATLAEAARALARAGVRQVTAICAARTT